MGQQTYENINPYTEDIAEALKGVISGENSPWQGMASQNTGQAGFENFQQMAPYLQQLVMGPQSTFQQGQMALAQRGSQQGAQAAMQNFSGAGGLYSGAAAKAAAQASINPYMQAVNNVNQMGAQMTGQLWNTGLGLSGQTAIADAQRGASIYGAGLSGLAGMGDPMMAYQPSAWDRLLQFGSLAVGAAPSILSGFEMFGNQGGGGKTT